MRVTFWEADRPRLMGLRCAWGTNVTCDLADAPAALGTSSFVCENLPPGVKANSGLWLCPAGAQPRRLGQCPDVALVVGEGLQCPGPSAAESGRGEVWPQWMGEGRASAPAGMGTGEPLPSPTLVCDSSEARASHGTREAPGGQPGPRAPIDLGPPHEGDRGLHLLGGNPGHPGAGSSCGVREWSPRAGLSAGPRSECENNWRTAGWWLHGLRPLDLERF